MTVELYHGDCLSMMAGMAENSIDTIITDPPYGLTANKKAKGGFMGKKWDAKVPGIEFWEAALRVAKPGAMMLCFGGTRTHHRLMCAIEDAGWEIRDCLSWLYGSGFPKSHDLSKAIDRAAGATREVAGEYQYPDGKPRDTARHQTTRSGIYSDIKTDGSANDRSVTAPATPDAQTWDGWGTALKPAWEPIILAMKPLDGTFAHNALTHSVAGIWVDGGRVGTFNDGAARSNTPGSGRMKAGGSPIGTFVRSNPSGKLDENKGRWPANLILDEHAGAMLDAQSGVQCGGKWGKQGKEGAIGLFGVAARASTSEPYIGDTGGASRFFYCAKASRAERNKGLDDLQPAKVNDGRQTPIDNAYQRGETLRHNTHPTVKPLALMRYLVKLTRTPTGGVVFDPFMGSGSTGVACVLEGRDFVGIELMPVKVDDPDYFSIAQQRVESAQNEMVQMPLEMMAQ